MNTIDQTLQAIGLDNLKRGELCIFAGAGISFNSGIPIVGRIKRYIFEKLCKNEEEREMFLSSRIPFEVFVEILFRTYHPPFYNKQDQQGEMKETLIKEILHEAFALLSHDTTRHDEFFKLFNHEAYQPNRNHYFIAEMLRNGITRFAVTTNFDLLIEKAYKEITGEELPVYFLVSSGKQIFYEYPCLLKLHGGCQQPDTIQTTIDKIASNQAKERCMGMVDHIFKSGKHSTVMVLGYSFSDVFDISPSIEEIKSPGKYVVNIKHPDCAADYNQVYFDRINEKQDIFRNYNGYQLHCATDKLIDNFWELYLGDIPHPENKRNAVPDIEDIIGNWAGNLTEPYQQYYICGFMMSYLDRTEQARAYFEKCLGTEEVMNDETRRRFILQSLINEDIADVSGRRRELDLLMKNASDREKINNLISDVQCKMLISDYEGALSNCEEALKLGKKIKNKKLQGLCYSGFANILNTQQKFKKSIKASQKALALLEDENDFECLKTKCHIYVYLAASYDNLKKNDKREKYLNMALELARKLNIESEMARIYFTMGNNIDVYINDKKEKCRNIRKAIDYFKIGYDFCDNNNLDTIKPMLRDTAFFLLGAYIFDLYFEDKKLVTEEELFLAQKVLKEKAEDRSLEKYGRDVRIETITYAMNACFETKKLDDALFLILTYMEVVDINDGNKEYHYQLLILLWNWFAEHINYYTGGRSSECVPKDRFDEVKEKLTESLEGFRQKDLNAAARNMKKAFQHIPINGSFKESMTYTHYRLVMGIIEELRAWKKNIEII